MLVCSVRSFCSSFSIAICTLFSCSCALRAWILSAFSATTTRSSSRRLSSAARSASSRPRVVSALVRMSPTLLNVSTCLRSCSLLSASCASSVLILSSSVSILSSSLRRIVSSSLSRSCVICVFSSCIFLYSSSSCISLNFLVEGSAPLAMLCSLLMRSSRPTIESCLLRFSSSLAARREGKESMKLVRSRSLATSSSYFSRLAASSAALMAGELPDMEEMRASMRLICSCMSRTAPLTCSTSLLSRLILAMSCSRCSSGLCLLRSSSCCSSYFFSVSCRICSCSCSDRCLSGLRASSPSCVLSCRSSSSMASSKRLASCVSAACSATRS
mmetsp:Transcript_22934/g.58572  ORF Transcript_22934/g.58572 Transcript_22934/m.58572 type:complete len:330 (+) Transcript_22934:1225-2214(+)